MAVSLTSRVAWLVPALLIVEACASGDRPTAPRPGPEFAISDGVHEGGTPGFYFLSPMVAQPTFSGTFHADITTLNPAIAICDITNGPDANCGSSGGTPAVLMFTTATTPAITLDPTIPQYQVNWDTQGAGFVASHTYRVHVTAGASGTRRELGFADVLLTTTPGQAKDATTGDVIVAKAGRTLPIHFRIEAGIPGSVSVSAATPSVPTGGTDLFTATVQDLHAAPLVSATVTWTVTAAPGVVARGGGAGHVGGAGTRCSMAVYAAGAGGNAAPAATIAGGNAGLNSAFGIALDGAGNIFVTNQGSNSITVYAAGASGNATPTATIAGGNTGLHSPAGIALDGAGNIYVTNVSLISPNSITVYAAGASGDATPTATIAGVNTGLNAPTAITF